MAKKRTPENLWLLTEEQIEILVHHYGELRKAIPRAAFHAKVSPSLAAIILKHKGMTRSPYDRPPHPWVQEMVAAIAEREGSKREPE